MSNLQFFSRYSVIAIIFIALFFPISLAAKSKQKIETILETEITYELNNSHWTEEGTIQKYSRYDLQGRLIEQKQGPNIARPKSWKQTTYDTLGNLTKTSLSPEGKVLSTETILNYKKPSERTIVNASGIVTLKFLYTYNQQGKLIELTNQSPKGTTKSTYAYDQQGNLLELTNQNPKGTTKTIYTYDGQGKLIKSVESNTHRVISKTEYEQDKNQYRKALYDEQGNEKSFTIGEIKGGNIKGQKLQTNYTTYDDKERVVAKRTVQRSKQGSTERIIIDEYTQSDPNKELVLILHIEKSYDQNGDILEEVTNKYNSKGDVVSTKSVKNIKEKDGIKKQVQKVGSMDSDETITVTHYNGNQITERLVYTGQLNAENLVNKVTYEYINDEHGNWIQSIRHIFNQKEKSLDPEKKVISTRAISYFIKTGNVAEENPKKSKVLVID